MQEALGQRPRAGRGDALRAPLGPQRAKQKNNARVGWGGVGWGGVGWGGVGWGGVGWGGVGWGGVGWGGVGWGGVGWGGVGWGGGFWSSSNNVDAQEPEKQGYFCLWLFGNESLDLYHFWVKQVCFSDLDPQKVHFLQRGRYSSQDLARNSQKGVGGG